MNLSVWDSVKELGVNRGTLYKFIRNKTIPSVIVEGKIYLERSVIDELKKNLDNTILVTEASKITGVKREVFYPWIEKKKIKGIKVMGRWRVYKTDVEDFVRLTKGKLTPSEAAYELEFSISKIHVMIRDKRLKARKVFGRWYIDDVSEIYE